MFRSDCSPGATNSCFNVWTQAGDVNFLHVVAAYSVLKAFNYLYPIPQGEIDKSGGTITQNPGY